MLRIYPVVLDWLKALRPLIAQIARHDRELAKQLRCSSSSVVLDLSEGILFPRRAPDECVWRCFAGDG
jgi:hypothetical protein